MCIANPHLSKGSCMRTTNKYLIFLLCMLSIASCYPMKQTKDDTSKQITAFASIDTVSERCIAILAQLDAQPLRKSEDSPSSISEKTLPLENYKIARLIGLLCN